MVRFQIYQDRAGYHRWRLIASNGEIVANSEGYYSRANAIRSAERVKQLAAIAKIAV